MNKKFDAYFIDLDGTARDDVIIHNLQGHYYGISKKNKDLIIAQNKITPIIISTGRDRDYVKKLLPGLNIKYGICQNGAVIINKNGKKMREIPIDNKIAKIIIKFAKQNKLATKVNADHIFYGANWRLRFVARVVGEKGNKNPLPMYNRKYNKISLFGKRREKIKEIANKLIKMSLPVSVVTSVKGFVIEITNSEATKGKAALWVCDKLNIDPKKTAHIGDTMNDTTAFSVLGAGIAMGNASDEVKQFAHFITTHYRKDGLKNALNGNIVENKNRIKL